MYLYFAIFWSCICILQLAGAAILIVGIIVAVNNPFKDYFTITVNVSEAYWIVVLVIIFTTAGILVAIGFLGCCGACKEHSCMLKTVSHYSLLYSHYFVLSHEVFEPINIRKLRLFNDSIFTMNRNSEKGFGSTTTMKYGNNYYNKLGLVITTMLQFKSSSNSSSRISSSNSISGKSTTNFTAKSNSSNDVSQN